MIKIIRNSGWLTGTLIFFMPVLLIFFLTSQMGYSQVNGKFKEYQQIPEITALSALREQPAKTVVMLRGQIAAETCQPTPCAADDLIVYRERPAEGREVRYQEEFGVFFPAFVMALSDGNVMIVPSTDRELIIQQEPHAVPNGDYLLTGFQVGDTVTVQGEWSAESSGVPALIDVTGITCGDKQTLMRDWESAFQKVSWARDVLGVLTGLGIILLIIQLRRSRRDNHNEETEEWHPPTTTTKAPPASP
ncbi:MAG: hypothetical protein KDJ52_18985 [Anaerolineae bacterium]|nr:hypothetical protein [Anaerolineae bacterium]